jgi:RNA polymerase sigma-70 factor (ECF subfamily)
VDQGGVAEAVVMTESRVDVANLVLARLADSYRLARAILLDPGEAEDAVQEASLLAWRRQGSLRDPDRFDAWFERILVNQCRDQLRRRRRAVPVASPRIGFDGPADPLGTGIDEDLDAAIARLDVDHRIVVVMRYWQDRTVDDIADRVGIPAGTVKSRLHHGLRMLRASLEASHGRS